jgi:hypothetical protein
MGVSLINGEEEILKQYPGTRTYQGEKPRYKDLTYVGEQDIGNFILTTKRLLFLRKSTMTRCLGKNIVDMAGMAGFLNGLPQSLVITDYVGKKISRAWIKPEEAEQIVNDDPDSLSIPLKDLVRVEGKRAYLVTAYLMVECKTSLGVKTYSFVFGTASKNQKELALEITAAKEKITKKDTRK